MHTNNYDIVDTLTLNTMFDRLRRRIQDLTHFRYSARMLSEIEFDSQTGLYTREAFKLHAQRLIEKKGKRPFLLSVSALEDFDHFCSQYSDKVVDEVVMENAKLVQRMKTLSKDIICGRLDRGRFIVLAMADQNILDSISTTYVPPTFTLPDGSTIALKMGTCYSSSVSVPFDTICQYAEIALQSIMHQYDKPIAVFDEQMMVKQNRIEIIEHSMKTALEQDQFKVYYQPKHDCLTGKLVGAEALIRWTHPELGNLSPAEFIPIFEQTGFVIESDYYVWCRTCQNLHRWQKMGLEVVPISVNSSRKGFIQEKAIYRWSMAAKKYKAHAHHLHIEVTETLFMDSLEKTAEVLSKTREFGIQIELDDFGTGYSSLNTLGTLPLDVVKLDMSFVRSLNNPHKAMIMEASIDLIHKLGMKVTAEGVETEEQLQKVREMGVDTIQGYYYSKPLSEEEFEDYLKAAQ